MYDILALYCKGTTMLFSYIKENGKNHEENDETTPKRRTNTTQDPAARPQTPNPHQTPKTAQNDHDPRQPKRKGQPTRPTSDKHRKAKEEKRKAKACSPKG